MKRFWIVMLITLIAAGSAVLYACRLGGWEHGRDMFWRHSFEEKAPAGPWMGLAELRPTKAQREKLTHIVMNLQDKTLPLKLEGEKKRIELSEMLLQANPDKAALSQKLGEMLKLKGDQQQAMLNAYFEISAILTPEQRRAFSHLVIRRLSEHEAAEHGFRSHDRMPSPGPMEQ